MQDDQRTKLASVPEGFRPTLVTWDTQGRRVGWLAAADTLDRWAFGVASPDGRGDVMEIVDVQILDIALTEDSVFAVEAHGRLFRHGVTESPDGQMTIGEPRSIDLGASEQLGERLAVEVESLRSGVLVAFAHPSIRGGPGGFLVLEEGRLEPIGDDYGQDDPFYNAPPGELVVLPGGAFAYTGHSLVSAGIGCDISAKAIVRSLTTDEITAHYPKPLKQGYGGRNIVALGRTDDDRLLVSTVRIGPEPECPAREEPLPSTLYEVSREGISEIASGVLWASERSGQIAALRASTSKADHYRPSLPGGDLLVGDSIDDATVVANGVFAAAWAPG